MKKNIMQNIIHVGEDVETMEASNYTVMVEITATTRTIIWEFHKKLIIKFHINCLTHLEYF